jgi:hypothetical protein
LQEQQQLAAGLSTATEQRQQLTAFVSVAKPLSFPVQAAFSCSVRSSSNSSALPAAARQHSQQLVCKMSMQCQQQCSKQPRYVRIRQHISRNLYRAAVPHVLSVGRKG